jgi:DtxR family Mn-dependent transcriptional regulator
MTIAPTTEPCPAMAFSQSEQDYVKAIYKLEQAGQAVSTTGIARKLGASAAAATKMSKHLAAKGLLEHTPYHGVRLTPWGQRVALEVIRHHRLLETFLHSALGYPWDEVDAEAERLEHHISPELEARIDAILQHPAYDPHGCPIPAPDGTIAPLRGAPLSEAVTGQKLVVLRVRDSDPDILRFLGGLGLTLGARIEVRERQPFNGPLTVEIGGQSHHIGLQLAACVFVGQEEADA